MSQEECVNSLLIRGQLLVKLKVTSTTLRPSITAWGPKYPVIALSRVEVISTFLSSSASIGNRWTRNIHTIKEHIFGPFSIDNPGAIVNANMSSRID